MISLYELHILLTASEERVGIKALVYKLNNKVGFKVTERSIYRIVNRLEERGWVQFVKKDDITIHVNRIGKAAVRRSLKLIEKNIKKSKWEDGFEG
jgi:DNA-binding PadR family transcriptional regulator